MFKYVDVAVQLTAIVAGLILGLFRQNFAFYFYFIVGGWQVLSCFIHGVVPQFNPIKDRKRYLITLGVLAILTFLIYLGYLMELEPVLGLLIPYGFLLLLFTPVMAIWYCYICYRELKLYQQKEWIQLK